MTPDATTIKASQLPRDWHFYPTGIVYKFDAQKLSRDSLEQIDARRLSRDSLEQSDAQSLSSDGLEQSDAQSSSRDNQQTFVAQSPESNFLLDDEEFRNEILMNRAILLRRKRLKMIVPIGIIITIIVLLISVVLVFKILSKVRSSVELTPGNR